MSGSFAGKKGITLPKHLQIMFIIVLIVNLFIQHRPKKYLFFLKDLLEIWQSKFINTWLQYQKVYILTN